MSRASAYRLRGRAEAESFAHAWDCVLAVPGMGRRFAPRPDWRKVTREALMVRVAQGLVRPVIHRGAMVGIARKADYSALVRLVRRGDALLLRTLAAGAAQ